MTKKTSRLELLQIPKPCPADWETMVGNERKRFCTECHKYVYNLSAMTRREAEALIEDSQGKVCARFTRLANGQVMTDEPAITLHHLHRPSPIAAALVTAMMSLSPTLAATQPSPTDNHSVTQTKSNQKKPSPQPAATSASLSGKVADYQDAFVVGAKVSLMIEGSGESQTTVVGEDGKFRFETLSAGTYIIKVEADGFRNSEAHGITLGANESQNVNMVMAPAIALSGKIVAPEHPLRTLYTNSDRVVIARVGESAVVETAGESQTLATTLQVSSTLKGADHKAMLYVYHSVYGDEQRLFKPGDNVLLFLTQREKQKKQKAGYELYDTFRGVKKLSDNDLKAYARHIKELADYLKDGKLENAELVEWLVRCAEDQATRWEGATELAASARELRDRQEEESDEAEEVDVEEETATTEQATEEPAATDDEDSELVAKLSEAQKDRLVKALLGVDKFNEGDLELLEVVTYFKDSRLIPFLVSHLRSLESAPPKYAENLLNTLAEFLNDETISEAVEKYSDEVSYDDLEDEEDRSEELSVDQASKNKTDVEQRSQLLKQVLRLIDQKLSQPTPLK